MATHKLQLTFDEATGSLTVTHRCTVEIAGQVVSHAEPIELDNADEVITAVKSWLDANREGMEAATGTLGVRHVAAVAGKDEPGVKRIKVGGSLGAAGGVKP